MNEPTAAVAGTTTPDAGEPTTLDASVASTTTATTTDATASTQATETQAAAPVVPDAYTFEMPEGVELDTAAADEFTAVAKDLKLTAEQAQKVADVGAKMAQRQAEAHAKLVETWTEAVKTDKEIGGDALPENLAIARKALDTFGTPELKDILNASGLGNHPAVIKAFYKAGKAISEDRFVAGSAKSASSDPAKTMFPSMN